MCVYLLNGCRSFWKTAEYLGLLFWGWQDYETDQSEPKLKTLIAIADYYRVSLITL